MDEMLDVEIEETLLTTLTLIGSDTRACAIGTAIQQAIAKHNLTDAHLVLLQEMVGVPDAHLGHCLGLIINAMLDGEHKDDAF